MLSGLDLTRSPSLLMVEILTRYDKKLSLMDYGALDIAQYPFTISSALKGEFSFEGSLREQWLRQYTMTDIRRHYGLNWLEWINQPVYILNHQLSVLPNFIEEKSRIINEMNKEPET